MKKKINSDVAGGIILFSLLTIAFIVSLNMRSKYKDYVATEHHHHLTATAVAFTNNWLADGMIKDHFAMIPNPDSVEFATLQERSFYDSYPSGCIVPLYLLARITGKSEITFGFVQRWNLFNQYMVTLILAFIVYTVFLRLEIKNYIGVLAGFIPVLINLFMPAPFYFFHSVYFADIAVLLPFVLTVFLEILLPCCNNKKLHCALVILEGITIFMGTLTDYLFLCALFIIYVKRLFLGEISCRLPLAWFKQSFVFLAPAMLAVICFVIQIMVNGPVRIIDMFLFRTGIRDESGWTEYFNESFWKNYIVNGYGETAGIIMKISLFFIIAAMMLYIIVKFTKQYKDEGTVCILAAAAMISIPCFMQVYLLKNHSAIHDFSSLKFSLVLSVVPYVLIPLLLIHTIQQFMEKSAKKMNFQAVTGIVTAVLLVGSAVNVYKNHIKNAESFFPEATTEYETVGAFLQENTNYNDVVFSDNYSISDANDCPQKIAYSKKRVYTADNIQVIYDKVKDISAEYTINIFCYSGSENGALKSITDQTDNITTKDNMYLYKISKQKFLSMIYS